MAWYGGNPSSVGRSPRKDAGNLAGMYGRTRGPSSRKKSRTRGPSSRKKNPRPGAKPPPRGRKPPKPTRTKRGRPPSPAPKRSMVEEVVSKVVAKVPIKKPSGKATASKIRQEAIAQKVALTTPKKPQKVMRPAATSRPVPRAKPAVAKLAPAARKQAAMRQKVAVAPDRSRAKTGQKRLKEVKQVQKSAATVQNRAMAQQKKVMAMDIGPRPTQLVQVQKQKIVAQTPVPLKRKPSSPRVAQQSKLKAMAQKVMPKPSPMKRPVPMKKPALKPSPMKKPALKPSPMKRPVPMKKPALKPSPMKRPVPMKKPALKPSPMKRPVPQPSPQQKMKAALKSKAGPTKQTPENYQDLIKRTGTKAPTKPSMRLDVMEKKRQARERMQKRPVPKKSPAYIDVIKKGGTAKANTPLEQLRAEKKITKSRRKQRAKKARPVPIKPFIHADKKVETKIDPRTKSIHVQKKVRGRVVSKKRFSPKQMKKAIATREKMKKEVVKQTKDEAEKPTQKVVRNVIITLEVNEKADPVSKTIGFLESIGSRWITRGTGAPVKTGSTHLTLRQQKINDMFAGSDISGGNTVGWY